MEYSALLLKQIAFFEFTKSMVLATIREMLLLIPLAIYSLLFLPFLGLIPYYDGSLQFYFAYNLYSGNYLSHWIPFHPPVSLLIPSFFFSIFGLHSLSLSGFSLGVLGIISMYLLVEKLFNKEAALVSSILLASSGLYISVGLFTLDDFVITVFILTAFLFYVRKQFILYSILASLAVLAKESALLFPIAVLIVELPRLKNKQFSFETLLPFFAFGGWLLFLNLTNHAPWNDLNFSSTADKGSIYTILHNLVTFGFLNKYAYENWLHLFIMNFNWVIWILAFASFRFIKLTKPIIAILLFSFLFILCVLSFQTYTITRYVLPVLSLAYIFAGVTISRLPKIPKILVSLTVSVVIVVSLFTSNDPISNVIWPNKVTSFGEHVYLGVTDGGDGKTYNMQYLFIAKRRNDVILSNNCEGYSHDDIYPNPKETFEILHITNCIDK